jgi:AraC-like DNA-binding protein
VHLQLNWINLVILFGGLQGLVFSIVLLFNKKHPGTKFLSAMIFVLAYNSLETFNWSSALNLIFFDDFSYILIFGIGPSLYLYVRSVLRPGEQVTKKRVLIHYGPMMFQFAFRTMLTIYETAAKKFLLTPIVPLGNVRYWHSFISEPLSVLFFLIYLAWSISVYIRFVSPENYKHTEYNEQARAWCKALLIVMACLGIMWPMTVIIPYLIEIPYNAHYYPIEIFLVFAIYWIAIRGYHKTQVIYRKQNSAQLPDEKVNEVLRQLTRAMEHDQLFLEPELSIAKISSYTEIPPKLISGVINQVTGKSVNDFINRYRVERVKQRLTTPGNEHLTLTGIALECGFNSQATFQRAFKQHTGMSPSEYINQQIKS